MANVPADLKYTREHEWAKREGDRVRIGITAFAQEQLGDVVFVELPKTGTKVTAHQAFLTHEALAAIASTTLQNVSDVAAGRDSPNVVRAA